MPRWKVTKLALCSDTGEFSVETYREIHPRLVNAAMNSDALVVDMSRINYIDHRGLVDLMNVANYMAGAVFVYGLTGQPSDLFKITKLNAKIKVFHTQQEAERAAKV